MADKIRAPERSINSNYLSSKEQIELNQKIDYELHVLQSKIVLAAGVINTLAAAAIVWVFSAQVNLTILLLWWAAVIAANFCNMLVAFYFKKQNLPIAKIGPWRHAYYVSMAFLCFSWGLVGILNTTGDPLSQLLSITFLLIALIAFSFGSVTEFTTAIISIVCLITPTLIFRTYLGLESELSYGVFRNLNIGFSIVLFALGICLLVMSYMGSRLIHKFFALSFVNDYLRQKLGNMNKILEKQVRNRTQQLEDSLKKATYVATHDLLTDLPNKRMLLEYMKSSIKHCNQYKTMFAVLYFSLNEIDKINDALGHKIGDLFIQTIAQRLKNNLKKQLTQAFKNISCKVTISRKDEFVILIDKLSSLEELERISMLVFSVIEEPVYTKNKSIQLTGSIGISVYPRDGRDVKSLLMNADAAAFRSKKMGGNHVNIYKPEINVDISKQLEMESDLYVAIKNNEFLLNYQPIVSLKTGRICGAEALLRWKHPKLGFIPPSIFIQLAEANSMIIPLGAWVLEQACLQTRLWHQRGYKNFEISVNLSAKQVLQQNFAEIVSAKLAEMQFDPKHLILELTETEAFKEEVIPVIKRLRSLGFRFSIDDFGTGYSGLSNLKLFDIDKLKIDRSFVEDIVTSQESRTIIANTINLAKKLKISIVAEGVETKEQMEFLQQNDCDYIQGYYFSPPLDERGFSKLLERDVVYLPVDNSKNTFANIRVTDFK